MLYVLDEPSIGLHQRDNDRLLGTLKGLRDLGNTVLVVEHDEATISAADYVIDLGPGAGEHGGHLVAAGTPGGDRAPPRLAHRQVPLRAALDPDPGAAAPPAARSLRLLGARGNNLKGIDVEVPLGTLTCVTGVSGSGKSTLVIETLFKALAHALYRAKERPAPFAKLMGLENVDKVIDIDQSPIGRTPRSNPATYTGIFTPIRDLFAAVPEARLRGYRPGRFSFNVTGGRCEACEGDGIIKIEMHFLPDVYVTCEVCKGRRYNRETLEVEYRGQNIAQVLEMTVSEALEFFRHHHAPIRDRLQTLNDVGLDYVKLGQSATTLSGGEAQRVKLSRELGKRSTGRTVYILDEPTTGLHFADIQQAARGAQPPRRRRQHRGRHRAQPRRHQERRLRRRPRPRGRRRGRRGGGAGDAGADRPHEGVVHGEVPQAGAPRLSRGGLLAPAGAGSTPRLRADRRTGAARRRPAPTPVERGCDRCRLARHAGLPRGRLPSASRRGHAGDAPDAVPPGGGRARRRRPFPGGGPQPRARSSASGTATASW